MSGMLTRTGRARTGRLTAGGAIVAAFLLAAAAAEAAPAALVEDISGPPAGVQAFDFVDENQVIRLQAANTLVLSYLGSCWRESIVGGTVRVGHDQSTVDGGQVGREQVQCNGGRMRLTAEQAQRSGGIPFRQAGNAAGRYESYGLSPIILMRSPGHLVITRVGQVAPVLDVNVQARDLTRGAYDLARTGVALQPGGVYRAKVGAREVEFRVNESARPGQVPAVSRLVQF
jgi:hypothetical protein